MDMTVVVVVTIIMKEIYILQDKPIQFCDILYFQ